MKISKEELKEATRLCVFLGEFSEALNDGSASVSGSYKKQKHEVAEAVNAAHILFADLIYEYYEENGGITEDMK